MFAAEFNNGREWAPFHAPNASPVKCQSLQIKQAINSFASCTLSILPNNPLYSLSEPFKTKIRVTDTRHAKVIFDGRVLFYHDSMDEHGLPSQEIECEAWGAVLNDSQQPYFIWRGSPRDLVATLIANHNRQVEPDKTVRIGNISATNNRDHLYTAITAEESTYKALMDHVVNKLNAELQLVDGVLDIVPQIGKASPTAIVLSRNLLSISRTINPSDIITRLTPLGASLDPPKEGNLAADRINIKPVNGNVAYLDRPDLIAEFGIQGGVQVWDDVHDANILKSKALAWLTNEHTLKTQYTVTAADLSLIDKHFETFELGNTYPVQNPMMGIDAWLRVVGLTIDCIGPEKSQLTIGDQLPSLADYRQNIDQEYEAVQRIRDRVKTVTQDISAIRNVVKQADGRITINDHRDDKQDATLKWIMDHWPTPPNPVNGIIPDVSEFQQQIDWQTVKAAGIALGIIRVQDGETHEDLTYKRNLAEVTRLGINYAVYAFFRGKDATDSKAEARAFFNRTQAIVAGKRQPRFYCIDVETVENANMRGTVSAYMDQLNALGIPNEKIVLYIANHLYDQFNLDVGRAGGIWIPAYGSKPGHPYDLHQYTSEGQVAGIPARVDLSKEASQRFIDSYLK